MLGSGTWSELQGGQHGQETAHAGTKIFYTLPEAVVLVEQWRRLYNTVRPHSACGGRPPAPETIRPSPWFLRMPQLQGPPLALGLT